MWLIHVGFMMYEAGVSRRKNIMSTATKNILTIAVVTPSFYYFGWYIYGCFEHGGPAQGHAGPDPEFPGFCGTTSPWADQMGPNLTDHISLVFFLAFLLFSWTTGSIMSGAVIERIRGVDSDYTVRSLVHRRLVTELGRADTPGRPILYGTGFEFLERFGLTSLDELPALDLDVATHLVDGPEPDAA